MTDPHGRPEDKSPAGESPAAPPGKRAKGHRKGAPAPRPDGETVRRCIVSGAVGPKEGLMRFVIGPDGDVVPDLDARLPGRGLWLSARRDMVETATAKRAFARAARQAVKVAPDMADRIDGLLRGRCQDLLGLARRAGLVVAGFDQVRAAGKEGQVALLLEAADGAADGRRKVTAAAPGATVVDILAGAELAAALGRDHVVHVAVLAGKPAQRPLVARLLEELSRLSAYRAPAATD
ncbi:RNA-binding protein [Novispirillum sp. DQ9]|uniref:RNA-binding protein n=1 Tax=Novispirillum sp. DQ9 TaxID=3398612 RepID=UPI003C7AEB05